MKSIRLLGAAYVLCIVVMLSCKTGGDGTAERKVEAGAETQTPDTPPAQVKAVPISSSKELYEKRWEERPFVQQVTGCFNCHETLARNLGRPAREHITSSHWRAAITCNECHGGDAAQDDVELAHSVEKGWIGKLNSEQMNDRCGTCHQSEVATFKASKHYPEHQGVRQVTCTECHGSHDVGARPDTFSWKANCASCHDLEVVPDLPVELVQMTESKDELHRALRKLRLKIENKPFPPEIMEPYREVRQLSANVIHATKAEGIADTMKTITEKNKMLEQKIQTQTGP